MERRVRYIFIGFFGRKNFFPINHECSPVLKAQAPVLLLVPGTGEDPSESTVGFKPAFHLFFPPGKQAYEKVEWVEA